LIVGGTFLAPTASAQTPALEIRIDTVEAAVYDTAVEVSVYMVNREDEVASFTLWIRLNTPDICSLRTDIVTAGTLIEGFEYVDARSVGQDGNDLRVTGISSIFGLPTPISPQAGDTPLYKFFLDVREPATVFMTDEAVLEVMTEPSEFFVFSDPEGNPIGHYTDSIVDTAFYRCMAWVGEECADWQRVSLPPYDTITVDTIGITVLDTAEVHVFDGLVRVPELPCGDFNGDNGVDLSDLIGLVNYLFQGGDPLPSRWAANVNGSVDGNVDLSDLIYMVGYLLLGGPPLQCY
jgi:hypothetical protein